MFVKSLHTCNYYGIYINMLKYIVLLLAPFLYLLYILDKVGARIYPSTHLSATVIDGRMDRWLDVWVDRKMYR